MKSLLGFGLISVLLLALWSTLILAKPPTQDLNQEFSKWIGQIMADCKVIKPGSTRKDLERHFEMDGGLCTGSEQRYVHHLGRCVKISVKFDVDDNIWPIPDKWKPSDKIIKVSKPYLEHPFID